MTGKSLTGHDVEKAANAWIVNLEDPEDEQHRRILAACKAVNIDPDSIKDRLFIHSGNDDRIVVARETREGVIAEPVVDNMIAEIQRNDIKLLVVDPFVRCHAVRENDNDAIDTVMSQFSKIAMETECAVLLVHHTGKTAGRDIVGDPDAGRGASSLVWGARVASTLTVMSKNDAQKLGISEEERTSYVRLDLAKANLLPSATAARWYERYSINIGNGTGLGGGDDVGVLRTLVPPEAEKFTERQARDFLIAIQEKWDREQPVWLGNNSPRSVTKLLVNRFRISKSQAKSYVESWLANDLIEEVIFNSKSKAKGVRLIAMPGPI